MQAQDNSGFQDLFNQLIGGMAKAIAERPQEGRQHQFVRINTAVRMILSFLPRDVIEGMLAGHCVLFHELMVDTIHHTLRGEQETTRRATRAGIVAMNNAFHMNLSKLEAYQNRHADGRRDVPADHPDAQMDAHARAGAEGPVPQEPTTSEIPGEAARAETPVDSDGHPIPTPEELTAMVLPLGDRLAAYLERAVAIQAAARKKADEVDREAPVPEPAEP